MENKYYTPIIEEFHVGFEFEVLTKNKYWETTIVGKYELNAIAANINSNFKNYYRVKYLDKEDVESLGFELEPCGRYYESGNFQLYVNLHPIANITIYGECDYIIFQGVVKNKSELKVILKQIGYENSLCIS